MISTADFRTNGATLPPSLLPAFAPRVREAQAPEPRGIVHLVDFDDDMQESVCRLFACVGIATRTYADVGAIIGARLPDAPGCLLIHVRLPLIGGLQFLVDVQRAGASLPIVVTADRADVRTAVFAMKAGVIDFLERPVRDQEILEAVAAAIRIDRERRQSDALRIELQDRFATLTPRERQVMALVTQGRLNKQVAGDLGLSEITVKVHRGSVMRKMGARTLAGLVRMADAIAPLRN